MPLLQLVLCCGHQALRKKGGMWNLFSLVYSFNYNQLFIPQARVCDWKSVRSIWRLNLLLFAGGYMQKDSLQSVDMGQCDNEQDRAFSISWVPWCSFSLCQTQQSRGELLLSVLYPSRWQCRCSSQTALGNIWISVVFVANALRNLSP